MNWIKSSLITLSILIIFFLSMEIISRAIFPEFKNQVFDKNISLGKKFYKTKLYNSEIRYDGSYLPKEAQNIIILFGDSVTFGYGLDYNSIYYTNWQRLLDLEYGKNKYFILPIASYGKNITDFLIEVEKITYNLNTMNKNVLGIIYQWNYNDIQPNKFSKNNSATFSFFIEIREKYLNYSVFQRVFTYYSRKLFYKYKCNQKTSYSYTFGAGKYFQESKIIWKKVSKDIEKFVSELNGIPLYVFLSPIRNHIDKEIIYHKGVNRINLEKCSNIDPDKKLFNLSKKLDFKVIDPKNYLRNIFVSKIKEDNVEPFFFIGDDNHFNSEASKYIAEYGYINIIKQILN